MFSALLSVILIINELMASNAGIVMSPATNFDSWIELYNPSGQAVSLAGMYLIDGYDNRWQMPKVIYEDFREALKRNKATVNQKDLEKQEEFTREFGQEG